VFDGDVAVAWCEYGTPEELPSIYHRKEYEARRKGMNHCVMSKAVPRG
jgi:hypothetical protein